MDCRLRSIHVIAGLDPVHGGPSYSVPRLCEALAGAGARIALLSVGAPGSGGADARNSSYCERRFAADYRRFPVLNDLRRSSGLSEALRRHAAAADLIHNHGLWLMPNVAAGRAARRAGTPLIVSTRGMLAPAALAFSRRKKWLFWLLLQGSIVRQAACLHATSEQEYEEIRAFGLANPVAVIPNGIDLPDAAEAGIAKPNAERVALSLGRIHPKKGLDRLVRAWAELEARFPNWRLRIAGFAEDRHDEELRALCGSLGLARITIEGPLKGISKTAAYREADLFVLPTLNENFGVTVAEALAAGTPVISTKGAPWAGLEVEGCGWWVDHGIPALAGVLAQAMSLPRDRLAAMGARGRAWMERDFSWDWVARDMLGVYRWAVGTARAPHVVRFA